MHLLTLLDAKPDVILRVGGIVIAFGVVLCGIIAGIAIAWRKGVDRKWFAYMHPQAATCGYQLAVGRAAKPIVMKYCQRFSKLLTVIRSDIGDCYITYPGKPPNLHGFGNGYMLANEYKGQNLYVFNAVAELPFALTETLVVYPVGNNWVAMFATDTHAVSMESFEFTQRFSVECSNRKFASRMLTQQLMQAVMALPGAYIQWRDNLICVATQPMKHQVRLDTQLAVANAVFMATLRFVELYPEHVRARGG